MNLHENTVFSEQMYQLIVDEDAYLIYPLT
jgi:hypothetical protein